MSNSYDPKLYPGDATYPKTPEEQQTNKEIDEAREILDNGVWSD